MANGLPEYQSREQLGAGPQTSVRGIPVSLSGSTAGATALSKFGEELQSVAEKLSKARDQADATTASSDYTKQLEALQESYSKDPDYKTALERFQKDRASLQRDLSQNISNAAVRQKTVLEWDRAGMVAANRVSSAALRTQKTAVDGSIETVADASLKNYSEAQSPAEKVAALELMHGTVKGAIDTGWVDAATGEALVRGFEVKAGVADAANIIKADPVIAQHALLEPSQFPTLDQTTRGGLIRTAQDTLTAQERSAEEAPIAQAFGMFAQGKLTPAWLAGQAEALPYPAQRLLTDAITAPPAAKTDPNLAWALLAAGNVSSDAAVMVAADARASGGITDPMLQATVASSAQAEQAAASVPWLTGVRGDMIAGLKPTDTQHPDTAIQQLGAIGEFDKYVANNPTASEFEARAEGARLARSAKSSAAFNERFAIDLPRFATAGPGGLTREKLIEAAGRTMQASDNQWLSDDELVEQVDLMRGWQDIFDREDGGGSK